MYIEQFYNLYFSRNIRANESNFAHFNNGSVIYSLWLSDDGADCRKHAAESKQNQCKQIA
jgi:hypothetical protein